MSSITVLLLSLVIYRSGAQAIYGTQQSKTSGRGQIAIAIASDSQSRPTVIIFNDTASQPLAQSPVPTSPSLNLGAGAPSTNETSQSWPTPITLNSVGPGNYSVFNGTVLRAVSPEEIVQIVNTHNQYRDQVAGGQISSLPAAANMLQLGYSTEMAQYAQTHAQSCAMNHGCNGCGSVQQRFGQNLYWGTTATFPAAIQSWFNEYQQGGINPSSFSFSAATGHFTQVAWATTAYVGCGAADCSSSRYIVCNYLPAGNFIGGSIYQTGTACSQCPSGTSCSASVANYQNFPNLCKSGTPGASNTSTTTVAPSGVATTTAPPTISVNNGTLRLRCTVE